MVEQKKSFNSAMLAYFIIVILFVTLRLLSSFGLLSFMGNAGDYVFTFVVQVLLMFGCSVVLYSAFKKQKIKRTFGEYGVKKVSGKIVLLCIALGAVVYFLNTYVSSAFNGLIGLFGYEHSSGTPIYSYSFGSLIVNVIFTALLPAICEEIAHRGMLLKSLSPLGVSKAIWISAIFFGLMHLNIEQFFYATIIGLFLGFLTLVSNSIIPAMIVHFMNNFLSTYLVFSQVNGLPIGRVVLWFESVLSSNVFIAVILTMLFIAVLLYLLYYLTRKIGSMSLEKDIALMQQEFGRQLLREAYLIDLENAKNQLTGEQAQSDSLERLKQFVVFDDGAVKNKFVMPKYGKLLLAVTMGLGVVLTICTFVWGAL